MKTDIIALIVFFMMGFNLCIPVVQKQFEIYSAPVKADPLGDGPFNSTSKLGYELVDNNSILHMWNQYNDYYFNVSNGIQFSNHYEEYWTHNVLMLGYYDGDSWNLIYRTDELSGFNKNITGETDDYINATIWKNLSYNDYDFRLAIRYHLGVNDNDLTVVPYIKNLGVAIPYVLGFGWEMKDIKIDNTYENDQIRINGTNYLLNQTLDIKYTNITKTVYEYNETTNITTNYTVKNGEFYLENINNVTGKANKDLYLKWNPELDYLVWVKNRSDQYNAPVTLFIKVGTLSSGEEKSTELHWHDATLIDSYSETNQDLAIDLRALHPSTGLLKSAIGQSFTCDDAYKITSAKFYLKKTGSPTGNGHAVLYAHSGTYGESSVPTGSALATSDDFDVEDLTTDLQLITFVFTGAQQYEMSPDTKYCIIFENPATGTIGFGNCPLVGVDDSSPTHDGNYITYTNDEWLPQPLYDTCFYVYGDTVATAPTVTTRTADTLAVDGFRSGGTSLSDGGASITAKGVRYGTNTPPGTNSASSGTGTADYYTTLSGLNENDLYYYRAYATNSEGTGYGSILSTSTLIGAPTTDELDVSAITASSITLTIDPDPPRENEGNTAVLYDSVSGVGGTDSGWDDFDSGYQDTGLSENSPYVYRAKFRNRAGTSSAYCANDATIYTYANPPTAGQLDVDDFGDTWIRWRLVDVDNNPDAGNTDGYFSIITNPGGGSSGLSTSDDASYYYFNDTGLTASQEYGMKARYDNYNSIDTTYCSEVKQTTTAAEEWVTLDTWNLTLSNLTISSYTLDTWNVTLSNTTQPYTLDTWNLTLSNLTIFPYVLDTWNITLSNTTQSYTLDTWNLTLSNTPEATILDTWNITLGNTTISQFIIDTWNLTLSNTPEANVLDTWNLTLSNLSISSFTIDTWNLTLGNLTISPHILDTWNITLNNISISQFIIDTWNLTLGNLTIAPYILDTWNLTLSNTSVGEILDTWNITLSNTTECIILDTWNITLGNLTISSFTIDTWNLTLSNTSLGEILDTWNLTLGNLTITSFTIDTWNVTLSNLTISPYTLDTWNITLSNTPEATVLDTWNLTLSNLTISQFTIDTWNLTLSNTSVGEVLDTWNITLSNLTISSYVLDTWNVTLSNTIQSYALDQWNITLSNTSVAEGKILDTWNLTLSNLTISSFIIDTWNITLSNLTIGNILDTWNITLSNTTTSHVLDQWNLTLSNITISSFTIDTWNMTLSNTLQSYSLDIWNLTLSNTTKGTILDMWNVTLSNTSLFLITDVKATPSEVVIDDVTINITCNVTSPYAIVNVTVNMTDGSYDMTSGVGDLYYYVVINSTVGTHYYHIYANDTSGDQQESAIYSFKIIGLSCSFTYEVTGSVVRTNPTIVGATHYKWTVEDDSETEWIPIDDIYIHQFVLPEGGKYKITLTAKNEGHHIDTKYTKIITTQISPDVAEPEPAEIVEEEPDMKTKNIFTDTGISDWFEERKPGEFLIIGLAIVFALLILYKKRPQKTYYYTKKKENIGRKVDKILEGKK